MPTFYYCKNVRKCENPPQKCDIICEQPLSSTYKISMFLKRSKPENMNRNYYWGLHTNQRNILHQLKIFITLLFVSMYESFGYSSFMRSQLSCWTPHSSGCICTGHYLRSVSDIYCAHQPHDSCCAHKHSFIYCLRIGHT